MTKQELLAGGLEKVSQAAKRLGTLLAKRGWAICNGGNEGTMEASARGAKEAGGRTIGISIQQYRPATPNRWLDEAIRKHSDYLATSGELDRRNRERVRIRLETLLKEKFMDRLVGGALTAEDYEKIVEDVVRKRNNPHDAAESMLDRVKF